MHDSFDVCDWLNHLVSVIGWIIWCLWLASFSFIFFSSYISYICSFTLIFPYVLRLHWSLACLFTNKSFFFQLYFFPDVSLFMSTFQIPCGWFRLIFTQLSIQKTCVEYDLNRSALVTFMYSILCRGLQDSFGCTCI